MSYLEYKYNYRKGLIVSKKERISKLTGLDVFIYNIYRKTRRFDPIFLNETTITALGFKKSSERYKRSYYYINSDGLAFIYSPSKGWFYCINFNSSHYFTYVHELQDFLLVFCPRNHDYNSDHLNFKHNYGKDKLDIYEI